jgi:hypothetical protein
MVSIFVSIIMILLISLVVLGFTQLNRRNQRIDLDSKLSTQAYYAAESGVNDAVNLLRAKYSAYLATGANVPAKDKCSDYTNYPLNTMNQLVSGDVSYTCVLIDPTPDSLEATVGPSSTVVPLTAANGKTFSSITLTWDVEKGRTATAVGCYSPANLGLLPVATGAGAWGCNFAALRTDLVKGGGTLSRTGATSWQNLTQANVFVPINNTTASSVAFTPTNPTNDGAVVKAACGTQCIVTISNLGNTSGVYYLRLSTLYRSNTHVVITGSDGTGAIKFIGSQAKIDSTGKAQDVLRRILVSVDLTDSNDSFIPSGALASGDSICKRFLVTPGYFYNESYDGDAGNNLCEDADVGTPSPSP